MVQNARRLIDTPQNRRTRTLPAVVALATGVAVLASMYGVPYLLAPVEGDLARDLYFGYRIATGQEWVAVGPRISEGWHLGPAWYYLLAAPMVVFKSVTGAVSMVALLAALKFPIAWRLGRELVDARFGLAWAILLALPGISSFESIWVAHPSLTATASLAVMYAVWRAVADRSYPWMYVACLGFGFALHAHPTTLPLATLLALAFLRIRRPLMGRVGPALICAALILLPFTPLLVDAPTQARDFVDFVLGVAAASGRFQVRDSMVVAANVFWHVPNLVVGSFLGDEGAAITVWKGFLILLYAVAIAGLGLALTRPELGLRRHAAGSLAYTLFSALIIVAVRNETRFYMVYALMPSIAFVQAVGLSACARSGWQGLRFGANVLLGGTVVAFVAIAGARFAQAAHGYVRLPALFGGQMDLRTPRESGFAQLDILPLWDLDAIGRVLCVAGRVRAYGDLAIVVDSQFNVPARLHCGERTRVVLGGTPGPEETALYLLTAAGLDDDPQARRFGALRLGVVDAILQPGQGVALASGRDYPARKGCASASVHDLDFTGTSEGTIVIASSLPAHCPIKILRLTVDGLDVTPARHLLSYFARAPHPAARSQWHLEVETGDVEAVQVFALAPKPRRPN